MPSLTGPSVSVVIPAYNADRFLADALQSVRVQHYEPVETIVVDDGSTDGTRDVAASFRDVRVVRQSNGGVSSARNHGIDLARGEFIAFLDADDVWLPGKLASQAARITQRPSLAYVYTGYRVVDMHLGGAGDVIFAPPATALRNTLLLKPPGIWVSSTCLFRTDLLRELGGFDTRLSTSADTHLALRAGLGRAIDGIPEGLALYRQHGAQMHHDPDAMARDMAIVFNEIFGEDGPAPADLERRARANLHATLALAYAHRRRVRRSARHVLKSVRHDPTSLLYLAARRVQRSTGRPRRPEGSR